MQHAPTDREKIGSALQPLIDLRPHEPRSLTDLLRVIAAGPLEKLLHFDEVNTTFEAARGESDPLNFLHRVLESLGVRYQLPKVDLDRIPRSGPLLVVANHPFGALDGILLGAILRMVRPDAKVMGNYLLGQIPNLRDLFIFVDPFGKERSTTANIKGMRQSLRWLETGGALAIFPAGEVAYLTLRDRKVHELPWSETVARIARRSKAPVLPIFFDGSNSSLFHAAGLLHARLRTAMLAREIYNKRGRKIDIRIGSVIPVKKLENFDSDTALAAHLRQRTLLLRHRASAPVAPVPPPAHQFAPIAPAVNPSLLKAEVQSLPDEDLLVDTDQYQVFCARAEQIPHLLRELGRLREITFRAAGEGTGKSTDLDEFDAEYLHLFVWNKEKAEVVGAYRLGQSDVLAQRLGPAGFYTRTLFKFDDRLLQKVGTGLEMGRSFVRLEYQKAYAPLLLLWKGIGSYCVRHPKYKTLFGPVSISNDYQGISKQLMVRFLKANHCPAGSAELVRPLNPFRTPPLCDLELSDLLRDDDDIAHLIAELEPDHKGIPVLLRQYLKLGAKLLAFNVDPAFNDAVDGLIVVDLTKTEPRTLERYMGKAGYADFMRHHQK